MILGVVRCMYPDLIRLFAKKRRFSFGALKVFDAMPGIKFFDRSKCSKSGKSLKKQTVR